MIKQIEIRRDWIIGTRKTDNYFWAILLFIGGIGFIYSNPFPSNNEIDFAVSQKIVMGLYGYIALYTCLYLLCSIFWNVGAGYNEYNKVEDMIRIVRWGFPGKNRRIDIKIPFSDIQSICIQTKNSFFFRDGIAVQYNNGRKIPLLQPNQTFILDELESYATQIAYFIQVPIRDSRKPD